MKNTKKSLVLSVVALLLCVSMLVGTTFAWFTDSVTSGTNKITAGNLDLDVLHTNAHITQAQSIQDSTDLFTDINGSAMCWEPGAVSYEIFTVKNLGELALKFKLSMNITDYNMLDGHTLKEVLKVKVLSGEEMLTDVTRDSVQALDWTTTDTLDVFNTAGNLLKEGSQQFQVIVYWLPTENDNLFNVCGTRTTSDGNPLFMEFGVNVVAAQLNSETDSFDTDYDMGIVLPDLPVSINKTFQSAPIVNNTVAAEGVQVKNASTGEGVATMPKTAVEAVITALSDSISDKKEGTDVSTVISLKVETTAKTETTVTYDIDLSAAMTYTDTSDQTRTANLDSLDGQMADKIIMTAVNVGKGLAGVTVNHDGTPMKALSSAGQNAEGFYYDKTTGTLTIKSKSFSPFTVSFGYEAQAVIGQTPYATLADAFAAAENGDTVSLLKNVSDKSGITVASDKGLNLNLNGKTLECTDSFGAALTVSDGGYLASVYGGTLKASKPVYVNGTTAHLGEIRDCTLVSTKGSYDALTVNGICERITDVTITGSCSRALAVLLKHSGTTVVDGLTVTASVKDTDENWIFANNGAVVIKAAAISAGGFETSGTASITVTGGSFATDPTAYLKDGYQADLDSGVYTVTKTPTAYYYLAKSGETYSVSTAVPQQANRVELTSLAGKILYAVNGGALTLTDKTVAQLTADAAAEDTLDIYLISGDYVLSSGATSVIKVNVTGISDYDDAGFASAIQLENTANTESRCYSSANLKLTVKNTVLVGEDTDANGDSNHGSGFQFAESLTVDNCIFTKSQCLWNAGKTITVKNSVFDCSTNGSKYAIWTRGSGEWNFVGCTFHTNGKAIKVYTTTGTVNVTECTFNVTNLTSDKYAVEIDSTATVLVTDCVNNGHKGLHK